MGYSDDGTAMWIVEHGGVLAVGNVDKPYAFCLQRDGWHLQTF